MKKISVHPNAESLIDDSDFGFLSTHKWYLSNGYAISAIGRRKMHRLILGAKVGEIVDHIDGDKLNNTRSNLRIVSKEENIHNQKKRAFTKYKYKGVQFITRLGLWQSRCRINHSDHFLGHFKSEIAAAYAYNKKAAELSNCILLNKIDIPQNELEKLLIDDRVKIPSAERKSNHRYIYWHRRGCRAKCGKWEVKLRINGKYKSFGRFEDEKDAIKELNTQTEKLNQKR